LAAAAHSGLSFVVPSVTVCEVGDTGELLELHALMANERTPMPMAVRVFVMGVSLHSFTGQ
jgi:hypothetical protein